MIDIRRVAIERAGGRCEYCRLLATALPSIAFQLDHVRARQHGGSNGLENLCYACRHCNLYKGTNQSAYDPDTDQLVRLFHPRLDKWDDHFRTVGAWIDGKTSEGRATVALLRMNDPLRIELRTLYIEDFPDS